MSPRRSDWRVARPTSLPGKPSVEGVMEPGADALPVRVTIVQDGVTTGWDDGALGFDHAAVWFSGKATSFRVAAGDLLPGRYLRSRREAVTDGEALRQGLPLRHPDREVWVRVEIVKTPARKEWEDEARLVLEIKRLRALTEGEGESQYPPLVQRPGIPAPPVPPSTAVARLQAASVASMFVAFVLHDVWRAAWPAAAAVCVGISLAAALRRRRDERERRTEERT